MRTRRQIGSAAAIGEPSRPVRWSLAGKLSLALLSILFCTLLVTAYFGYAKFDSVYSAMVRSRYSYVVFTIKKRIEDSLNLGLPLRQLRQVQDVIEREKTRDSRILAIEVYDFSGMIQFDTDRGAIGLDVSSALRGAARAGGHQPFAIDDDDTRIVGLPLVSTLGRVEGAVVLRYPVAMTESASGEVVRGLIRNLLIAFALFGGLAVAVLYLLFGRLEARLTRLDRRLSLALDPERPPPPPPAAVTDFEGRFQDFIVRTRETVDHVTDATEEVGRLDRLA